MPYTYRIDADHKLGIVRLTGSVNADLLDQAADAAYGDAQWKPHFDAIWDLRPSAEVIISLDDIDRLLEQKFERDAELNLEGKVAILIDRDSLVGVAHLYRHRASHPTREVQVFVRERYAREWLGLPEEVRLSING